MTVHDYFFEYTEDGKHLALDSPSLIFLDTWKEHISCGH